MEYVRKNSLRFIVGFLVFLEVVLALYLVIPSLSMVTGAVGENVTVATSLTVGTVYPEILNVTVDNYASSITLTANSTKLVVCEALLRDYNNDSDFYLTSAEFFDTSTSSYGGTDDNNDHYTNASCAVNTSFVTWNGVADDDYLAVANCTFQVEYYANPSGWNCTVFVNDTTGLNDTNSDSITVDQLLAVGLPSTINYGTVNATYVSSENITNVTNVGNVALNISLSGYGNTEGDDIAMDCTLGSVGNISIEYEKYNLTGSNPGTQTLSQFEANYTNLTSSPSVREFDLGVRLNDTSAGIDDYNQTYWRIYVPLGVAGTCNGTILFGATTAVGA